MHPHIFLYPLYTLHLGGNGANLCRRRPYFDQGFVVLIGLFGLGVLVPFILFLFFFLLCVVVWRKEEEGREGGGYEVSILQ